VISIAPPSAFTPLRATAEHGRCPCIDAHVTPLQRKIASGRSGIAASVAEGRRTMGFEPWLVTIAVLLIGAAAHNRTA